MLGRLCHAPSHLLSVQRCDQSTPAPRGRLCKPPGIPSRPRFRNRPHPIAASATTTNGETWYWGRRSGGVATTATEEMDAPASGAQLPPQTPAWRLDSRTTSEAIQWSM